MNRLIKGVSIALLTMTIAPSAYAVNFGISSGLGTVRSDSSFYNDRGVNAKTRAWIKDGKPGGNKVYVQTDYLFYRPACGAGGTDNCWYSDGSKNAGYTNSATYDDFYSSRPLRADSEKARGVHQLNESRRGPDLYGDEEPITTFSY